MVWVAGCGDDATRLTQSISLDPANPQLAAGKTLDVTASYVSANQTTTEASDVTWSVSDASIATVAPGAGGHATLTGVNAGSTTLTVSGAGTTGTFTVMVTPAVLMSISITPPTPSIAAGTSTQLTATGMYSDTTTMNLTSMVTWSSTATATATVDAAGVLKGVAAGTTTIAATLGSVTGTVPATITAAVLTRIGVTPIDPSLPLGIHQQFTATGVFSDTTTQDLTTQVTWSSDHDDIVSITAQGAATAAALGTATISAAFSGVTGTSRATVTAAVLASIAIDPPTPSAALGRTLQLTATGTFTDGTTQSLTDQVTWASDATGTATVSNDPGTQGLVTTVATGTAGITATLGTITGSTTFTVTNAVLVSIQVTPVTPTISAGTTRQFTAKGTFSDASTQTLTTQVTWTSSDETVATISNADPTQGLATSVKAGTTTIAAALDGITGDTLLTVSDATLVSIEVTPANQSLAIGLTLDYTATGVFSDMTTQNLTDQVTWTSSDDTVASISNAAGNPGQAKALKEGAITISATFTGAVGWTPVIGTTSLTVTPAALLSIDVAPANPSLPVGHQLGFTATGQFTDGPREITTQVGWSVAPDGFATISNAPDTIGVATAVAVGSTTVTATFVGTAGNVTGSTTLTVVDAVVDSIALAPLTPSLANGLQLQFHATATLSNGNTEDVTTQATWSSDTIAVAQVDSAGNPGLAKALSEGTATISAAFGGKTGSTVLTVTAAVLVSIDVEPATTSLAVSGQRQFTATGMLSDGLTQDLTKQATWTSSDDTVATVSNADPTQGLATAVALGTVAIHAAMPSTGGPVVGTASLTVTDTLACDALANPANGTVATSNGGIFPSTATYTCSAGFAPLGSTSRTCTADGSWTGAAPTCNAVSVMVVRVGDGTAALGNGSTAVFVEQHSVMDGSTTQMFALPTATNPLTMTGNATSEGGLARSVNGKFVTLAGYAVAPGTASIATTTSAAVNRVVGRIDAGGAIDATTLLSAAFSGSNPRAATTVDGTSFWVSGTSSGGAGASGGVHFAQLGSTGASTRVLAVPDNSRWIQIVDGQLYASSASGQANGIFTVGTGLPTVAGATATVFSTATPAYGFALFDRSPTVVGPDVMYASVDANVAGATNTLNVQKWTFNGTTWAQDTSFKPALATGNSGARGLAAWIDAAGVHVVATTNDAGLNRIVSFTDDGSTETPAVTVLATAAANTAFRGVALSPVP